MSSLDSKFVCHLMILDIIIKLCGHCRQCSISPLQCCMREVTSFLSWSLRWRWFNIIVFLLFLVNQLDSGSAPRCAVARSRRTGSLAVQRGHVLSTHVDSIGDKGLVRTNTSKIFAVFVFDVLNRLLLIKGLNLTKHRVFLKSSSFFSH